MPSPEEVAARELRRLRLDHGWSQEEVAKRMSAYGYDWHQTMVARVEAAQRPLRLNEAADMAALFGVTIERLMWPNPDLTPEELEAEIRDANRRYLAAHSEWATLRNQETKARQDLDVIVGQREEVQARMAAHRAEMEALGKLRDPPQ